MRIFYTDGSMGANGIKAGGWAFVEVMNNKIIVEKYEVDDSEDVSSNKMELKAVIEAVKELTDDDYALIHSDSQYVLKGLNEHIVKWKRSNWLNSRKEPVVNKELWIELLELTKDKNIQWVWVRGHANDKFNHRVDELSKKCYSNPSKINSKIQESHQIVMKPDVGSLIYFKESFKKYIVILNDVRVGENLGFLARLLANSLGNEMDFFPYSGERFTIVKGLSKKEQKLTLNTLEQFNKNVAHSLNSFKNEMN